ncbi:putative protein MEI2-like 2 [Cocos nucifera]|uniref:RRM domain-containing protein n=2 Tax=Magnoliopsida TaxID=3398 RepID=A0A8K0HY79_COCNU|nr:putative protein MEI2-like 2 [Cocos nucifera]
MYICYTWNCKFLEIHVNLGKSCILKITSLSTSTNFTICLLLSTYRADAMEQSLGGLKPTVKTALEIRSNAWGIPSGSNAYHGSSDASLFSSSLPVLPHEKLIDDASSEMTNLSKKIEGKDSVDDLDLQGIGSLLPDDEEELLAGIMNDFDLSGLPSHVEELEEYDLFGSGGGIELDSDPTESLTIGMAKASIADGYIGNGISQYSLPNGVGTVAGEHPYGEHPSRTLFVRNINSNVEDSELRSLFEDNPSDKDMNQGTLVIFNLDPSVSNDDLRQIFGAYGEVKEIRETPHKRHHKFLEFYDVRAAEAALRALNKSDIAGKRIKLEPSRPGGARRSLMQQLTHELEQDESRIYRHYVGSPITSSPPGTWAQYGSPGDNNPLHALSRSPTGGAMSPMGGNHLPGLASVLSPVISNSVKIPPIGKDQNKSNHAEQVFFNSNSSHGVAFQHSRSFPEHNNGVVSSGPGNLNSFGLSASNASGIGTLSGPQFLWGSPTTYSEHSQSSAWQSPSMGHSFTSNGHAQGHGFLYSNRNGSFLGSSLSHHHVGSAPSGLPFERNFGFFPESPDTSFMNQVTFGNMGISQNDGSLMMNMSARASMNLGSALSGNTSDNGSPNFRMISPQRLGHTFFGNAPYTGPVSANSEGLLERGRSRRADNIGSQVDSKKQYQLDLEKIVSGEDTRTTLMIKNIPNKYTSKMLLAAIDENHKGTYDFLYLPIDFKNKCNVGYAFINMVSPSHIISFYQAFNGKKWEKFNSEKVASLAYARIQGKAALVAHFQNSSLMNEDKRCRPILFHYEGPEGGDQEPFPLNGMNIHVWQQDGTLSAGALAESPTNNNPRMHLPTGFFKDEVCQFATRKRVAPGVDSLCVPKKSRAAGPSIAQDSIDAPLTAPPIVTLHASTAAATFEAPPTVIRSEEDVVIIDMPTIVSMSGAQSVVAAPAPRSTSTHQGRSPSPSTPEWVSCLQNNHLLEDKERRRFLLHRLGVMLPTMDIQTPNELMFGSLKESRRSQTLADLFRSFYLTFIELFPDLDLSNIVILGAEEEEEGGDNGSPMGPTDEDLLTTALVPTKLVIAAPPEGTSTPQSIMKAPLESQGGQWSCLD